MDDAELPEISVAVQVTRVSPSGNTSGASLVMEETPTSSELSGIVNATAFSLRLDASIIRSSTKAIRGNIESIKYTD